MKTIQNLFDTVTINGEERTLTVGDLLKECVNVIPKDGLNVEDIAARLKIVNVINQAKANNETSLIFEDADFKTAASCVKQMRWAIVHKFIIDFCNLFTE